MSLRRGFAAAEIRLLPCGLPEAHARTLHTFSALAFFGSRAFFLAFFGSTAFFFGEEGLLFLEPAILLNTTCEDGPEGACGGGGWGGSQMPWVSLLRPCGTKGDHWNAWWRLDRGDGCAPQRRLRRHAIRGGARLAGACDTGALVPF